jgi:foldase protein PrsA
MLIGGLIAFLGNCWAGAKPAVADPVATINGQPISRDLIFQRLMAYHGVYALENLIGEMLIEAEAKKRGVTVTEEEITAAIEERKESLGIGSEDSLRSWLLQNEWTEMRMYDEVRLRLLLEKVFAQEANVTDAEVEAFYNRNKASFRVPAYARIWRLVARTEEVAQKAIELLKAGRDFTAAAQELGPALAQATDAAVPIPLEGLPAAMRSAIEKAPLNEISGPLKVPQNIQDPNSPAIAYWVIKVEERQAERLRPFSEVKEEIRRELFKERVFGPFGIGKRWMEQERERAVVERFIAFSGEPQPR